MASAARGGRSSSQRMLAQLRRVCLPLPEVVETKTFGNPTFQAGKKTFAVLDRYEDRPCIAFKAERAVQARLCATDGYAPSPFGKQHGWTLAWICPGMDWPELSDLIVQSYRLVALRRMLKLLDGE